MHIGTWAPPELWNQRWTFSAHTVNCLLKQDNFLLVEHLPGIKVCGWTATYSWSSKDSDCHVSQMFVPHFPPLIWSYITLSCILKAVGNRNPTFRSFICLVVRKRFTVSSLCMLVFPKPLQFGAALLQVQFFSPPAQGANILSSPAHLLQTVSTQFGSVRIWAFPVPFTFILQEAF